MPTEDCNCKAPPGFVKAKRLRGFASGVWGSAQPGEVVFVPREVAERDPERWEVLPSGGDAPAAAEPPVAASQDLESLTVPQLTALAAERNVALPSKARKAEIVQALTDAGA